MKYTETAYISKKEILKFPDHYVALAVTVDDTGITANSDGKKIVLAGTVLGGGTLANDTVKVSETNTNEAEGVLLYDVDVTHGSASGTMIVHGYIDLNILPKESTQDAITAVKQIRFIK